MVTGLEARPPYSTGASPDELRQPIASAVVLLPLTLPGTGNCVGTGDEDPVLVIVPEPVTVGTVVGLDGLKVEQESAGTYLRKTWAHPLGNSPSPLYTTSTVLSMMQKVAWPPGNLVLFQVRMLLFITENVVEIAPM